MESVTTKKEQGTNHRQGGTGGDDCPAKGLVDTAVQYFGGIVTPHQLNIVPDPVKNDDGIVDGIPHNGEDCRYHRQGDFNTEEKNKS